MPADGRITWSLDEGGLAKEFHLTTDEIRGKSLGELFPGGASDAVKKRFEHAFEGCVEDFVDEMGCRTGARGRRGGGAVFCSTLGGTP